MRIWQAFFIEIVRKASDHNNMTVIIIESEKSSVRKKAKPQLTPSITSWSLTKSSTKVFYNFSFHCLH